MAHFRTSTPLSSGVILNLENDQLPIAASADEVKYYRVWSALAAEQEKDQRDLFEVATTGRMMWDRKFQVDHSLGTVEIPEEFRTEFVAAALEKPLSEEAMLVESYKQMLDRMLEHHGDVQPFTDTLNHIKTDAIPGITQELEDDPRLNNEYDPSFVCAFSTKHGGPIIRCDLFNAESGAYAASVEAPFIIADGEVTKEQLRASIVEWFSENGPGRLEAIARANHRKLTLFIKEMNVEASSGNGLTNGRLALNGDTAPTTEQIRMAERAVLFKTPLGRQSLRTTSLIHNPLSKEEMPLFELPTEIFDSAIQPVRLSTLGGVSVDGLTQVETSLDALKALPKGITVTLDTVRGVLLVTDFRASSGGSSLGSIVSRMRGKASIPPERLYPLRVLNNVERFLAEISAEKE